MLDAAKLATLRAVIEHGSFSAAGATLALTQPAVSRQVSLLEAQLGTQLVRRTRQGVRATEAGRVLAEHADAILGRIALAEEEVAELAGLRRGRVRLGSFFNALVFLSAHTVVVLGERHPGLLIEDHLVDRQAAFRGLAAGELDVAIVFEHAFEPAPAPAGIELVALFDDPPRVFLPADHRLARRRSVALSDLADETWVRAHDGSGAALIDHVLGQAGLHPPIVLAGRGDEPVEAQALVAAGKGVTVAHALNVVITDRVVMRPLAGGAPVRHIQAAVLSGRLAPAAEATLDALRTVGRERATRRR
jgi:DNA-binding transcriptional LysR family regulator